MQSEATVLTVHAKGSHFTTTYSKPVKAGEEHLPLRQGLSACMQSWPRVDTNKCMINPQTNI